MIDFKLLSIIIFMAFITSSCSSFVDFLALEFTEKQCEAVRTNFEKLKIGMTKSEVLPLIGGERKRRVNINLGRFKEQKTRWEIYPLCYEHKSCVVEETGKKTCYEWQMIAFDTETNKVVKIFSDDPESIGFL